jgi:hypothetical protein
MFFSVCAASLCFNSRFGHIPFHPKRDVVAERFQHPAHVDAFSAYGLEGRRASQSAATVTPDLGNWPSQT